MSEINEQIKRIEKMEGILDKSEKAVINLEKAINRIDKLLPEYKQLVEYYDSEDWKKDCDADDEGKLPKDLKRGVLSEDAVYDLISDVESLKQHLKQLIKKMK